MASLVFLNLLTLFRNPPKQIKLIFAKAHFLVARRNDDDDDDNSTATMKQRVNKTERASDVRTNEQAKPSENDRENEKET